MSVSILIFISWIQISWTKKNGLLDSGQKLLVGSTYTMTNISQYQAGVYICEASNGVGYPVLQHINLTVLCKYSLKMPDTSLVTNCFSFGRDNKNVSYLCCTKWPEALKKQILFCFPPLSATVPLPSNFRKKILKRLKRTNLKGKLIAERKSFWH